MSEDDGFMRAYREAQALRESARPDQAAEALRPLACEVAYGARYRERLPLDELTAPIAEADKDAAGMAHLGEVLRRLRVTPSASGS